MFLGPSVTTATGLCLDVVQAVSGWRMNLSSALEVSYFVSLHSFWIIGHWYLIQGLALRSVVKCHVGIEHQCIIWCSFVKDVELWAWLQNSSGLSDESTCSVLCALPSHMCKPAPLLPQRLIHTSCPLLHHHPPKSCDPSLLLLAY